MTAGKRRHLIIVEVGANSLNDVGTPVFTWSETVRLRAEIVQEDTAEFIRTGGAVDETAVVFRTIWAGEITTAHRVRHAGRIFNIKAVVPSYRQFGVELRCTALNGGSGDAGS